MSSAVSESEQREAANAARFREGVRVGLPYAVAAVLLSISFGVLAQPLMGNVAPIVMSAALFAGSAQFASTAVLAAGGGAGRRSRPGSCSTCATCRWALHWRLR